MHLILHSKAAAKKVVSYYRKLVQPRVSDLNLSGGCQNDQITFWLTLSLQDRINGPRKTYVRQMKCTLYCKVALKRVVPYYRKLIQPRISDLNLSGGCQHDQITLGYKNLRWANEYPNVCTLVHLNPEIQMKIF